MGIKVPLRVMLDEGRAWSSSKNAIEKYVDDIVQGGFNAICPCVWHGQGATWDSAIEPLRDPTFKAGPDLYKYLVKLCKEQNIFLIPWFTISLAQRVGLHDEWRLNENMMTPFFNVWRDEFRAYITSLVDEFVDQYACDGVFLDFMRSGHIWNTVPGRQRYMQDTGRNFQADFAIWYNNAGMLPIMSDWIRRYTESLLVMIHHVIKTSRPADIFSYGRIALGDVYGPSRFGDWLQGRRLREWQMKGLVDWIFIEAYEPTPDVSHVMSEISLLESKYQDRAIPLLANYVQQGEAFNAMDGNQLVENIQMVQKAGSPNHTGIYFYNYYTKEQCKKLRNKAFMNTRYKDNNIICTC